MWFRVIHLAVIPFSYTIVLGAFHIIFKRDGLK
jgi:hypothetical protein